MRRSGLFALVGIVSVVLAWTAMRGSHTTPTTPPAHAIAAPAAKPPITPPPAPEPVAPPPRRVVIISEDGMRPDVLDGDRTPRHVALMREGEIAHRAHTIPESDTLPSHASMLSGVGAAAHGLWWNSYQPSRGYIHVPTIFSIAHAHGLTTAMFVGKPKLKHIAIPGTVDHFERPGYLCGSVARRAAAFFRATPPDLMFVHFSDPDEYGHSHGWMSPEYLRAVAASDRCLATVLDAIDEPATRADTLVIVTADHGGHGKHHSGGVAEVDRDIPWIVRGPGVAPGGEIEGAVATTDTAVTALAALGLPRTPEMKGRSPVTFAR
ncbi:MAG TPA: alkaline phosphatase family protein [Kofleriaceae bacterium]|nr:alkaline phosphatase family protein [Kofleriaceae bacterium]